MNNGEENSEEEISFWTLDMDLAFQQAMMENQLRDHTYQLERTAAGLAGQTAEEVRVHHDLPAEDICRIESGWISLPNSIDEAECSSDSGGGNVEQQANPGRENHRRWTVDEHVMFLLGILRCGRGKWRRISRRFVKTKTPSQVASHAQKYYLRQDRVPSSGRKHRQSIHDISVDVLIDAIIKYLIDTNPADQTHGLTTGYPEIQANESVNEQLIQQTFGPANMYPSLNIDVQMNGSSVHDQPLQFHDQLPTLPSMQPAPTWSPDWPGLYPHQLTPETFVPQFWSGDPCASSLDAPPAQSQQDEDDGLLQSVVRSSYSRHNPVSYDSAMSSPDRYFSDSPPNALYFNHNTANSDAPNRSDLC